MAEDRFANIFTAVVTMSAANVLTYLEMSFGITLRDRIAIVIDELYFFPTGAMVAEMTTTGDSIIATISISDQPSDIRDLADRRILYTHQWLRLDLGTAAGGVVKEFPMKQSFAPPIIVLPNRLFFGVDTVGLASAGKMTLRMHYRTVSITQDQQLIEVLEAFQMST